ncbi:MAG: cadherin-like beta sandwich domain-containing protein [Clostridia bacterium]|nr:cadherin-like beta sandwich domain-containing protein [Clostridia bacterium]
MKKYITLTIISLILMLWTLPVKAASFSMTTSTNTVKPNGTFTISVGGDCIGRVDISVSNGTVSKNSVWVEENYQTVTVTAGGSGNITVTATPVTGFSDSDANEYNPGSRSVTVQIAEENTSMPSNNNANSVKPQKPTYVDNRSSDNRLSSIVVSSGNLSPTFEANISEYSVQLPSNATSITISAESIDNKARITGTGEIKLDVGDNIIVISVIAENGLERKYTINAYVDETPQVYIKYKDKNIGVVRNLRGVAIPEGFERIQHAVNEHTIDIFKNEHFSIFYGINETKENNFYIIDTTKNECISKIVPITINNKNFYVVDLENEKEGFEKSSMTINNMEVIGYRFKEEFDNYFLLSVMNNNGEMIEYIYETSENTFQIYSKLAPITYEKYQSLAQITDSEYKQLAQKLNIQQLIIYIISTLLMISIGYIIYLFIKSRKGKSHEKETH